MSDGKNKNKKTPKTKNEHTNDSKSILRASSEHEPRQKQKDIPSQDSKKSIKWDEMNVIATLHPTGKDYGHMNIDEAPTPYERPDKGVDAKELTKQIEEAKKKDKKKKASNSYDYEEGFSEEQSRRASFIKKRQEHYSEFTKAKQFSQQHKDEDDD